MTVPVRIVLLWRISLVSCAVEQWLGFIFAYVAQDAMERLMLSFRAQLRFRCQQRLIERDVSDIKIY